MDARRLCGSVRGMVRTILISVVIVVLRAPPAPAAPADRPTPLGVVLVVDNAHPRPNLVYGGATIYDGDRLQAPSDETLLARLGPGQIVLRENSSAIVRTAPHGFSVELETGSVAVSSGQGQTFQVLADGATVRSLAQPASAEITKLSGKELILTSRRGILEASIGGEVKTVAADNSYRMDPEAGESEAGQRSSGTRPPGRSHFVEIVVPPVAVATILFAIRALESGDRL